jgi:hypothetical protein
MLVYIVILILIVFYTKRALTVRQDFQLIQAPLRSLTVELLLEKYPVIVSSDVMDMNEMIETCFRYLYVFKDTLEITPSNVYMGKHRFTLLHNINEQEQILHLGSDLLPITIHTGNIVIVPAGWSFQIDEDDTWACMGLNDILHTLCL